VKRPIIPLARTRHLSLPPSKSALISFTQFESRVDGSSALSSMGSIAWATAAGRSSAGFRSPALGRGSLCRKASFPLYVVWRTVRLSTLLRVVILSIGPVGMSPF
jgi:hypothetical protein